VSDRLTPIVRLAPAKLNLTLAVLGRRPDGYHDLHSVMVPLGLSDRLSLAPAAAATDAIHVSGFETGAAGDNLVLRAIDEARDAVRRTLGPLTPTPPLAVRLEKRIPVAAGLAGGSSDAAAALDGALEAWSTALEPEERLAAAARIGSDVPFFLTGGAAVVEGRGERVTPLGAVSGGPPAVLIVTPAIAVHTRAAFAAFDTDPAAAPPDPRSTRASSEHLAVELRGGLRTTDLVARAGVLASANDLAAAAFVVVPGLLALRRGLVRLLVRPIGLSGSGPTLWALYPSLDDARIAAETVTRAIAEGILVAPGDRPPFVIATTIDTQPARDSP
jgi:4-diphosphocytidyl-2-C-methyl-D-erythritol kinase